MVNNGKFEVDEKIVQSILWGVIVEERKNIKSKKHKDSQMIKGIKAIIEDHVIVDRGE